jgi:hypothetical protein
MLSNQPGRSNRKVPHDSNRMIDVSTVVGPAKTLRQTQSKDQLAHKTESCKDETCWQPRYGLRLASRRTARYQPQLGIPAPRSRVPTDPQDLGAPSSQPLVAQLRASQPHITHPPSTPAAAAGCAEARWAPRPARSAGAAAPPRRPTATPAAPPPASSMQTQRSTLHPLGTRTPPTPRWRGR